MQPKARLTWISVRTLRMLVSLISCCRHWVSLERHRKSWHTNECPRQQQPFGCFWHLFWWRKLKAVSRRGERCLRHSTSSNCPRRFWISKKKHQLFNWLIYQLLQIFNWFTYFFGGGIFSQLNDRADHNIVAKQSELCNVCFTPRVDFRVQGCRRRQQKLNC